MKLVLQTAQNGGWQGGGANTRPVALIDSSDCLKGTVNTDKTKCKGLLSTGEV